jgi:predicted dehydrogenase
MDRDHDRAVRFADYYGTRTYPSLEALLSDERVEIVVNLTNPGSHFEVSKACLEAGKHVYSEKPLATNMEDSKELVELSKRQALYLSSAPCSILGETAQSIWKALRENRVGRVRAVYAELDSGPINQLNPEEWFSKSGAPWPYQDEFQVGCALEHAGYYVTWLVAFFGRVQSVTAFSSVQIPDKHADVKPEDNAPDFTVACLQFASGVVARVTCSIVGPHDHRLRIMGDTGVLSADECWHYASPVYLYNYSRIGLKAEKYPLLKRHGISRMLFGLKRARLPSTRKTDWRVRMRLSYMDLLRGVAEMASAIHEQRENRLSADYSLHVNEVVLAIQNGTTQSTAYKVTTPLSPMEPMPWAR